MALASVLGHERARAVLGRALLQGRVPRALLLSGPEGVGKRTLALEVARALLCVESGDAPCGACTHCGRIARALAQLPDWRERARADTKTPSGLNHRLHPDLMLVEAWPTGIKVEQARQLVDEVMGRPFEARARVFVVDDAHLLTEQAANALLKSLEEPPASSHLMLVTGAAHALPATIRSRCQTLRLSALPLGLLASHLQQQLGLTGEEARLRATVSGGSLGAALAFEGEAFKSLREELLALLESLPRAGASERIAAADALAERDDPNLTLTALRALLRDLAALRCGARPASLLNADVADRLARLAQGELGARALRAAESAAELREALRGNANRPLSFDVLLAGLCA